MEHLGLQLMKIRGTNLTDDTYLIMESHALTFESMGRPTKMLPTSQHAQNIQALDIIQRIEAIYI